MVPKISPQLDPTWRRYALSPHDWRSLAVAAVLLGALAISAALVYFQPGTRTFASAAATAPTAVAETSAPLPPGIELYYYWGQHRPLDQQP